MAANYSQRAAGILAILADRPVAYHPKLATVIGVKETVFVCQLLYWDGRGARKDGFVWKVQSEITEETGLSRYEQETVRKNLIEHDILEEKLKGIPAKLHYRLNFEALAIAVEKAYPPDNDGEIPLPSSRKPCKLDRDVSPDNPAEITQPITEITPQITSENTTESPAATESPVANVVPSTFQEWLDIFRDPSTNKPAALRQMYQKLYPEHPPPDYGYCGKVARRVGGYEVLAMRLWELSTRAPVGDVLAYVQGMKKNGNGSENRHDRNQRIIDRAREKYMQPEAEPEVVEASFTIL